MNTSADRFVRLTLDDTRTVLYPSMSNPNDFGAAPAVQAVQMLNAGESIVSFITAFEDLKIQVVEWLKVHRKKISKAFITAREEGFVLLVVTQGYDLDDEFEDALPDLAIAVKRDRHLSFIPFTVRSLPYCEGECFHAFCNPQMTLAYEIENAVH